MTCCDTKQSAVPNHAFGACMPGALVGGLVRTRFFDGMVLTQADLENEQRFWRLKRRLTNRALGEGVVWGLRLRWDARRRLFSLGPGYALDCCGNDLIVECPIDVAEADLLARVEPAVFAPKIDSTVGRAQAVANRPRQACIVLQYVECPEDPRPVHLDPCTPPTSRCEPSRIRETTRLLLVPPPIKPADDCLDGFFAELQVLKDSITDPVLRDQLFPPAVPPSPTPFPNPSATLPATLRVAVVGSGTSTEFTLQPPANGVVSGGGIVATRVPPTGALRAGVVQFELRPHAEWGFTQGKVTEGGVTVDVVAPPVDLHQFWALEVTFPGDQAEVTEQFEYRVENLGIERVFGDHTAGTANLLIRGSVSVRLSPDGAGLETSVKLVTVESKSSIGSATTHARCLDHLRYVFMERPERGEQDLKALLLSALYAYLADVSNQSGGAWTQQRLVAAALYALAWRLLGVNVAIPNAEAQKQELARILAHLFQCWCDAMLYPGPRCTSEHHGVYLGCATIGPNGQILTFDMWEHRRQVLTGPWLQHVLGVFGLASVDVIAGRFAQTICCVAGLPLPTLPPARGTTPTTPTAPTAATVPIAAARPASVDGGVPLGRGMLWVSSGSQAQPARELGRGEFLRHVLGALVGESTAPLVRFRTRLGDGAVVDLLAPSAEVGPSYGGGLEPAVRAVYERNERLRPLAMVAARMATLELAQEVSPTALPDLSGPAAELAKALAGNGLSLAGIVDAGAEGLLAIAPTADPHAVDDISLRATKALAGVAEGVTAGLVKTKPAHPSALLRDPDVKNLIAADLAKRFSGVTKARVEAALERAALRAP